MRLHPKVRSLAGGLMAVTVAAALMAACSSSSSTSTTTTRATTSPTSSPTTAASNSTSSSSTATTTATTANFNSCSVVTQAQAASALGQSVTPGVLGTAVVEGGLACVFYGPSSPTPTDPNVSATDSVRVVVVKGANAATWYNAYKSSPQVHAQALTGYGDQAFYDGYASVNVLKGDTYLRIAVAPAGAPPSLTAEQQLANAILPNL